jgi:hypothetical protein
METFSLHKYSIFPTGDFQIVFMRKLFLKSYSVYLFQLCWGGHNDNNLHNNVPVDFLFVKNKKLHGFSPMLLILLNLKNYHLKLKTNGFTHGGK